MYSLSTINGLWFLVNRKTGLFSVANISNLGTMLYNEMPCKGCSKSKCTCDEDYMNDNDN